MLGDQAKLNTGSASVLARTSAARTSKKGLARRGSSRFALMAGEGARTPRAKVSFQIRSLLGASPDWNGIILENRLEEVDSAILAQRSKQEASSQQNADDYKDCDDDNFYKAHDRLT